MNAVWKTMRLKLREEMENKKWNWTTSKNRNLFPFLIKFLSLENVWEMHHIDCNGNITAKDTTQNEISF